MLLNFGVICYVIELIGTVWFCQTALATSATSRLSLMRLLDLQG